MHGRRDHEHRVGMLVACAVCCGVPMLVAIGIISIGVAVVAGAAVGALGVVGAITYLVLRGGAPAVGGATAVCLLLVGLTLVSTGLLLIRDGGRVATTFIVMGVAALASLALLRLPTTRDPAGDTEP